MTFAPERESHFDDDSDLNYVLEQILGRDADLVVVHAMKQRSSVPQPSRARKT